MKNKLVGGEQELYMENLYYGSTNSGRSSLRWIIESMNLRGKKALVPDFLCQIVVDVLRENDIDIVYYNVETDLSFELKREYEDCDVLYVVRYFGENTNSLMQVLSNLSKPTIIDDVFGIEPPNIIGSEHWCYFNSLRKISYIADYSQIITNKPLKAINKKCLSDFYLHKYQGKKSKYLYINKGIGNEEDYLNELSLAEYQLNDAKEIYSPSEKSTYLVSEFYKSIEKERNIRINNLCEAKKILSYKNYINIEPDFPSYLPLIFKERNVVRRILMKNRFFLAVHWPELDETDNDISPVILSLPLDSRYDISDIERVCLAINNI